MYTICSTIFKLLFLNNFCFYARRDSLIFIHTLTIKQRLLALFPLQRQCIEKKVASSISDEERRRNTWSLLQLRLNSKQLLSPWWQTLTELEIFMMHSPSMHAVQDLSSNALYSRPRHICLRRLLFEIR